MNKKFTIIIYCAKVVNEPWCPVKPIEMWRSFKYELVKIFAFKKCRKRFVKYLAVAMSNILFEYYASDGKITFCDKKKDSVYQSSPCEISSFTTYWCSEDWCF